MYAISDSYKQAVKSDVRKTTISGTITTISNKIIEFNDSNIQKGSLYITNQCVNSDELEFGSIFTAECGFTIKCDADRYSLYGAEVNLVETRYLLDGSTEDIPLGTYYINEVTRMLSKITIVAYDSMLYLDTKIEEETQGNVYDLLNLISSKCKLELAQSKNEIELLPNATREFTVKKERLNTYRDLLSALGQVTATFGIITRDNRIKLQSFSKSETTDIDSLQRKSSRISDFETYFNSVKASFIAETNYYPYEVESDDPSVKGGLQLDIGEIPIVQGLSETKYAILNEILDELIQIRYTPCEIQIANDSSLELGDLLKLNNVNNSSDNVNSLITYYKWIYHGLETLKSAGGNPKLNSVKSKTDKAIESAINSIDSNDVVVYSYENVKEYNIKSSEVEIIKFQFATKGEANPILLAQVQFSLDIDGEVTFKFYEDDVERTDLAVTKYYERGKHFTNLFMNAKDEAGTRNQITVRACCRSFESDNRILQAKINNITSLVKSVKYETIYTASDNQTSFELPSNYSNNSLLNVYVNNSRVNYSVSDGYVTIDSVVTDDIVNLEIINIESTDYVPKVDDSVPLMNILPFNIHAVVYSQGLSATESTWDGTISVSDEVPSLLIKSIGLSKFNLNVSEVIE